jgi:hypothetical protein
MSDGASALQELIETHPSKSETEFALLPGNRGQLGHASAIPPGKHNLAQHVTAVCTLVNRSQHDNNAKAGKQALAVLFQLAGTQVPAQRYPKHRIGRSKRKTPRQKLGCTSTPPPRDAQTRLGTSIFYSTAVSRDNRHKSLARETLGCYLLLQTFAALGPADLVEKEDPGQSVHITIVW